MGKGLYFRPRSPARRVRVISHALSLIRLFKICHSILNYLLSFEFVGFPYDDDSMSEVKVEGYKVTFSRPAIPSTCMPMFSIVCFFQTSEVLAALAAVFEGYNNEEKAAQLKKVWSRWVPFYI